MANRWSQIFTLDDIIGNKEFRYKFPYIDYKEKETQTGEISQRTRVLTVRNQVFDVATMAAKPFYSAMTTTKSGDQLILDGEMIGNHDQAVDTVYFALQTIRSNLGWTANTANMLRYAMKEARRNKHNFGIDSKLYLRAQSKLEIKGMNRAQDQSLLSDIIDNIIFGDDFPETQKKFAVDKFVKGGTMNYKQLQEDWKRKVGAL